MPTAAEPLKVALTSGASCPDVLVDEVLVKILDWHQGTRPLEQVLAPFEELAE